MNRILQEILDWSEVWATLIPLTAVIILRPKAKWIRPVFYFLVIGFILYVIIDVIWKRYKIGLGEWMHANLEFLYDAPKNGEEQLSNAVCYNILSIIRFLLFAWFFHYLSPVFRKMNWVLVPLFGITLLVIFTVFRDIRDFSSLLMGTDSAILLAYCLVYYFLLLRDEDSEGRIQPPFWAVLGLSIYVVINFPIFLFYNAISKQAEKFAIDIWTLHNITYIIFCIFLAKAVLAASRAEKKRPGTIKN
jgi:hypothetical protein